MYNLTDQELQTIFVTKQLTLGDLQRINQVYPSELEEWVDYFRESNELSIAKEKKQISEENYDREFLILNFSMILLEYIFATGTDEQESNSSRFQS
jgi:hypothetical protein